MSPIKDGWALALMVLSLLFLPQEKLAFWFADRPEDWYGELAIRSRDHDYVLVKNRSPHSVDLRNKTAQVLAAITLDGSSLELGVSLTPLPKDVYALLAEQPSGNSGRRRAFGEMVTEFVPPRLYVATEAEDDISIMLLFVGAALMASLGFSIGLFFHEARVAQAESSPGSKQPSQG